MNNELSDQPYTFLRIKRKRNEEPLDALVVESGARRKKPKGRNGVFQFARTIEEGVWEDEEQKKAIQHQLSILAHQPTTQEAPALLPDTAAATSSTLKPPQATDIRRYTIIERSPPIDHLPLRKPTSPPQILSSRELATQRANSDFKMYDAVLENPPAEEQIDPALEKLLQDYLKRMSFEIHVKPTRQYIVSVLPVETSSVTTPTASKAEDYVWDIFYHRPRTYTQSLTDVVAVGTVSGLPPLASGDSDSDSYSEEEDEADEDSNAEEWYTNDYPEEEESDWSHDDDDGSDEFHENTVDSDVEHEWR
ncbi:hypothetical protein GGU10DRAFT_427893 [Lentinula aff. detonsa]|uniref:Probable RNA polymerase II nuclear localization protein SLC7A6OS n=1 Tax=Lentinula aff. detonsa TaxID=2804958 RepID=A0AA38KEM4_9AGAR|nr:hypothetical protein GGU10DRAFT_427893 [Lentinula aff. detonsa]